MKTKVGITERKRVPQPGGARNTTKPLKGRRIFLHVQGYRGAAKLENDVTLLGGTVEKCFSRDVNCVVTNRGSPTDYEKKKKPSSVSSPSPVTPSPFNLATPGVDSPQGHSPGSLEVQKPLTRGKAMMQAATRSTRTYGTMDVIEMARSWKLKIIHIDSALRWIKKEIEKVPETLRNNREDASKRQMKVRKLRGPYMKFEATTRSYRPLYQEFSRLPDVGFDTAHWTCPFLKGKQSAKIDERGEGEEERDPQQGDDLLEERDASPGHSQKKDTPAKKSKDDGTDDLFGSPILTAGEIRHMLQERKRAELKRGYCEICQIKYDNIDKHTSNNRHREFVCNNKNYSALDEMITEGSNMKQFVADVVMAHNLLNDYDDRTGAMSNDEVLLLDEPTPLPRPKPKFLSHTSDPKNKANSKEPLSTKHNTPKRKKSGHTPNKPGHRTKHSIPSPRHKANTDKAKPSPKQTTPSKSRTQRESAANLKTPTKQPKHNRVDKVQTPKRVTRGSPQIVNEAEDRGRNVPAESPVSSRASRSTGRGEPAAVEQNEQSKAAGSHEVPVDAPVKPKTEHDATTSSAKLHMKSVEKGESPRRKRLTRRSLQPTTGDSPQLPESRTESGTECQRESRGKDAPESTQDSTARVLLKRLGIDATEGTPSPETKTRRTRVSSPAHKPVSANTNQSSSQRCASKETTHQSTTDTGDTYLLKRLGVTEAESPMVTNRTRRHSILSPELNPVSIKAMKDEITPRTARTIKCLLKKKGTPRVVCPRLDMDEINKSQDSLTTADSVSHATSQSDSQTNLDEGGPVRKVRSSRRSHTSSVVVSTLGTESKPVALSVRPKEPSVKAVEAVQPDASKKSGDSVCREERVDTGRQTRRRTSITVPAETNRSPNEQSQVKENRTTPRKKSLDDRTSAKCDVKREKSTERTIKKEPTVAGTSEKAMTSTPAQPSACRKVRLKKNWALVTDRSMRQILREHGDDDFEGFTKVDSNELPSDTSYEDVSEVEVGEEWEISGTSVSTVGSPAAVISTGLDCDNSSPTKSSPTKSTTGLTPIKHVLGNISNIMSEASSTGWDDNLDDFLEGQLKRKTAKDDANASGLFTSLLVQVGSPRRSPRKSPLKNAKSPFKFVASPLTKTKTPGHNVAVRSSPRNHTPGQNASLRNSPKGQTPQTANRTLDFNTPNFSLLDTLGEVDDLWVGPTKNELLSRSYTQKAADRLAKTSTPGGRTPIYQPQPPRKVAESTPTTSMSSTSKQSSVSAVASPLSSQSSVDQRKRIPFGKSPKAPSRVASPTVLSESPTSQNTKSKVSSKTTVPKSPTTNSQMVTKVDEEVEFNFSSPSKRVKETLKEMIAPSPITPIENKTQPKKRLLGQMLEVEGPAKKKSVSDSFDFDEPDEVEMPKKRLLKSLSNTKKKFTLSYVPSFEYKGGSSLEHNTTSSPAEPKGKSGTPSVVLANLGRSVTPRTDNGTHSSPLSSKAQKPAAAAKRLARTPHKETKPMPSPSLRNNTKTTATTPQHSDKSKKRLATGDASPEPSSGLSTPRTLSPGRRLDKLLALHSLEDIQFGPRRKSSNVSSIVRFHYDSEEEDAEVEQVNDLEQLNKSGSKVRVGGKSKDSSRGNTPKRHSLPSRSASTNLDVSSDSAKRTVSSKPHTKTKRSSPLATTKLRRPSTGKKIKLRSPSSDKKGKSPDWSQAKPASGSRSMSRLHYTKWPKTKYTDWSKSKGHSRSKSAVELAKKRSLQSGQNNKKSPHVSPGNRRHSSPRKRLRMDTSPSRASSRTRSHAAGVKTRDNGERSNLKRSVKRAVNYTEEGSPGDH